MKNENSIHILFASRLVEEKGVDVLIETIEQSMSDEKWREKIFWTICSDGLLQSIIERLKEKYPENVSYLGKIERNELARLYRESDYLFMPSRFLETFGLTALESLACETPVIGFRKGGLISFIPEVLALDPHDTVNSFFQILETPRLPLLDVSEYSSEKWKEKLSDIFKDSKKISLIHDYREKIGGAEYYVDSLEDAFYAIGKEVSRYSYHGATTPWKRKFLFIFSLFAFWRYFSVLRFLRKKNPDIIWMHSIMRYIGFWGLFAVRHYSKKYGAKSFLSHHDVGLLAPFPQSVREEGEISTSFSLSDFTKDIRGIKKIIAIGKWCYVGLYRNILPQNLTHILFSPFMEEHIRGHFGESAHIIMIPHSYDERIFYP